MKSRDEWREYVYGRAELHCKLLRLIREDQQLAHLQPPGFAALVGTLCAELTHRASTSEQSEQDVEQAIEAVLWNRIRDERDAA